MKSRILLAALALFGAVAGANSAAAQSLAYAVPYGTTNMRAGPGLDYQVVAVIRGGSAVNVYGCLADFSWCDSSVENIRGWVSTTRLEFQYGGNRVPIPRYYSYFDAPIIGFDFGYWDRYYSDQPFYRDRPHRRRHRDYRPPSYQDDQRPGIFPEEGGRQYQPPFSEDGGNRHRDRGGNPPANRGGDTIFPEEGGRAGGPPPAVIELPPSSGQENSGPACPPGDSNCQ